MPDNEITVMVIDDSVLIRKYVSQVLSEISGVKVIATAPNGKIGLKKLYLYQPDFIILDMEMPEMNGLEFLRYLNKHPQDKKVQIIVLSSIVSTGNTITFEALSLGAQDFITKPQGKVSENLEFLKTELELKIRGLHNSSVKRTLNITAPKAGQDEIIDPAWKDTQTEYGLNNLRPILNAKKIRPKLIAIGSSTGGPNAIRKILESLGPIPVPMLIAQHMPPGFTREFANNLASIFNREVKEAVEGEILENGVIYICPGGYHSTLNRQPQGLSLLCDPNEIEGFFFKPSVDIFLGSIYQITGPDVIGLILSGMGKDGSQESAHMRKKGALMIAQDKESSVVWGMPGSSVKNNGIDIIIPIEQIGAALNQSIQEYFPEKAG